MPVDLLDSFDLEASLAATQRQNAEGALKIWEDLERYRVVIEDTKPDLIIECGTHFGKSAEWFVRQGVDVVTVDLEKPPARTEGIVYLTGDSTDPYVVEQVAEIVDNYSAMVVLDSDHRAAHVWQEIVLYGPLVTPGCYLVVEDCIVRYLQGDPGWPEDQPGPLEAIERQLIDNPMWVRDREIESMHPVTMNPAGWWRRA